MTVRRYPLRVHISSAGRSVAIRRFDAIVDGRGFTVVDTAGREVARGDLVGGETPIVTCVEHDAVSMRGIEHGPSAFARALMVAMEAA